MATQSALLLPAVGAPFEVGKIPIPKPGPGELLVKIHATALNPVDWISQDTGLFIDKYPAVLGCDAAGTVEEIGEGVSGYTKGDRVIHQSKFTNDSATFKQYSIVEAQFASKIPDELAYEDAASIPLGLATAAIGLYNTKGPGGGGLTPPWEDNGKNAYAGKPLVVIGGATSVGQYAIQLGKLSGFSPIIAVASPRNTPHLKSLGATHVIDRHIPLSSLTSEVKKITSEPIGTVYDAISDGGTQQAAYDLLSSGGVVVIVLPPNIVETESRHVSHVFGVAQADQNRKVGASLHSKLPELLKHKLIVPNKVEILSNGLASIPEGTQRLKRKEVSAVKLIARPQETT